MQTMAKLQKYSFIIKKCTSVWIINPDILMKDNDHKRHMLFADYKTAKIKNTENENISNETP